MRLTSAIGSLILLAPMLLSAQNAPAPAAITQRLDTPQARVFVATLQPRTPSISKNGHATHRVLIYMDDGAMTRTDEAGTTTIAFKRGDVRWRPASGPYTAENTSDHPIRLLEIDLKGPPAGPLPVTDTRSRRRRSAALHGGVRERVRARAARALRAGRERAPRINTS